MNEIDLRHAAMLPDEPNKDFFCWQFVSSLENYTNGYWHGRLIGLSNEVDPATGKNKPYKLTFLGKAYTEKEFREKVEKREICIVKFSLPSNPTYRVADDPQNPGAFIAEGTAHVTARIDGELKEGTFNFTHKIRPTFLSYETVIS